MELHRAILQEKCRLGGKNEIRVHRNIAIHDNEDNRLLLQLPEEVLWTVSKDGVRDTEFLHAKVCETDEELLCISLKKPPRFDHDPHALDSCSDLLSFFNFSKEKGYRFQQYKWPKTHIKNYRYLQIEVGYFIPQVLICLFNPQKTP